MDNQLNIEYWEWWKIKDVFNIFRGKGILTQERKDGDIPYISAKNNNNGLERMLKTREVIYENVLGWVNDGDGGVGYCFYHPYKFRPSNHVTILKPKEFDLTEEIGLFLATVITQENKKHSRGFSINNKRANETRIKLPTFYNPDKNIDFAWIRKFMINCKKSIKSNAFNCVEKIKRDLLNCDYSETIATDKWEWFELSEIFTLKKGKRLISHDFIEGDTPFIGSIDKNNGLSAFVGQKALHEGNVITVNYNGSVGEAFYQPYSFWASDDVNVLYPKFILTPNIAMFLITIIRQEKSRFAYGRKWNLERMQVTKIKLPVKVDHTPDFDYMNEFIARMICSVSLDHNN